jgi:hypothetical protein
MALASVNSINLKMGFRLLRRINQPSSATYDRLPQLRGDVHQSIQGKFVGAVFD